VVRVDESIVNPMNPGFATRVTVVGDFTIDSLYIGPVSARNPWMADVFYPLTWNGGNKVLTTDGSLTPVWCDALPIGVDGTRGFLISGYFDPGGNGVVGFKYIEPGWAARYAYGDYAADLDKSSLEIYTDMTTFANVIVVQDVDGYYTPPGGGVGILP
jgi:hypothetical protein